MTVRQDVKSACSGKFSDDEREAVYRVIFERRDVRRNFVRKPIADEVLARILTAAHHAGSVGFMQPWDFVVIRQRATKRAVKQLFTQANTEAAKRYDGIRSTLYRSLKLEGIEEAPINLCVTCPVSVEADMSWAVPRCERQTCTAPVAPFKTSGWPRERKALELDGSALWIMGP